MAVKRDTLMRFARPIGDNAGAGAHIHVMELPYLSREFHSVRTVSAIQSRTVPSAPDPRKTKRWTMSKPAWR